MFGMGIFEILVVVIVAIIFLGPEKFPQAIVDIAKFFRAVKKTLNDAKDTLDKEINIEELKKETLEYQKLFENNLEGVSKGVRIEELEDAKMSVENEIKSVQDLMQDYEYSLEKDKLLSNLNEEVSSDESFKETELVTRNNTEKHDKEKEHV
ncbi:Sec-independent protein translocase protein TatB [Helicobacter cetorum]|uniref:Sec-independent protein translocase protein TatB homolog n=1 Tax=Helicobacter cetorum (strain ATCC BAA-540 / CCUG 52418 / MIT 99-5656) TaxID=1163745 RepID=I0ETJ2_HELCM|nr:Sec-independent protein translocase protein TatB [Helicobacter cetorum]AFI06261.1 sec-independent translocase [Helicobacter cetorum MIT 99-5656]